MQNHKLKHSQSLVYNSDVEMANFYRNVFPYVTIYKPCMHRCMVPPVHYCSTESVNGGKLNRSKRYQKFSRNYEPFHRNYERQHFYPLSVDNLCNMYCAETSLGPGQETYHAVGSAKNYLEEIPNWNFGKKLTEKTDSIKAFDSFHCTDAKKPDQIPTISSKMDKFCDVNYKMHMKLIVGITFVLILILVASVFAEVIHDSEEYKKNTNKVAY